MPFIDGFIVGFAMIVFVGPVLFTLLQITLNRGFWAGFMVSLAVFISDIVCAAICYYGAGEFVEQFTNSVWIPILGALILWAMGLKYILKPNLNVEVISKASTLSLVDSFTKGFLVNFVNPFVFGVWIAVVGMAKQKYSSEKDLLIYLFAATFAVFVTDTVKVVFAQRLRPLLKPIFLKKVFRVIGVALLLFGIRVFAHIFSI